MNLTYSEAEVVDLTRSVLSQVCDHINKEQKAVSPHLILHHPEHNLPIAPAELALDGARVERTARILAAGGVRPGAITLVAFGGSAMYDPEDGMEKNEEIMQGANILMIAITIYGPAKHVVLTAPLGDDDEGGVVAGGVQPLHPEAETAIVQSLVDNPLDNFWRTIQNAFTERN